MLIDQLIQDGYLKTPRIIDAFKKIKRIDFIPEELKQEAEGNYPLSIGWGQTISQPLTVAFMLELLQPEPGNKILDIGSGSGWVTALLAEIISHINFIEIKDKKELYTNSHGRGNRYISSKAFNDDQILTKNIRNDQRLDSELYSRINSGKIYAIERIPELKEFGENNIKKYNFMGSHGIPIAVAPGQALRSDDYVGPSDDRAGSHGILRFAQDDRAGSLPSKELGTSRAGIVQCFCQDGTKGLPEYAPFDKIHVAAAAEEVPSALKNQLAVGGRMIIPAGGGILKLDRINEKEFKEEFFSGFVFVPLIENHEVLHN